jgi:hypothetical protein
MTQTYADFDVQVAAVLGRKRLAARDYQAATAVITRLVLRGAACNAEKSARVGTSARHNRTGERNMAGKNDDSRIGI